MSPKITSKVILQEFGFNTKGLPFCYKYIYCTLAISKLFIDKAPHLNYFNNFCGVVSENKYIEHSSNFDPSKPYYVFTSSKNNNNIHKIELINLQSKQDTTLFESKNILKCVEWVENNIANLLF